MKSTSTFGSITTLYIFRVLHISSMIGLSYKIIKDYLDNTLSTDYASAFAVLGVIAMASGKSISLCLRLYQYLLAVAKEDGREEETVGILESH
jgi:hypothetical protein